MLKGTAYQPTSGERTRGGQGGRGSVEYLVEYLESWEQEAIGQPGSQHPEEKIECGEQRNSIWTTCKPKLYDYSEFQTKGSYHETVVK